MSAKIQHQFSLTTQIARNQHKGLEGCFLHNCTSQSVYFAQAYSNVVEQLWDAGEFALPDELDALFSDLNTLILFAIGRELPCCHLLACNKLAREPKLNTASSPPQLRRSLFTGEVKGSAECLGKQFASDYGRSPTFLLPH